MPSKEITLADGIWTLLWEKGESSEPPMVSLSVLNSDWRAKLKFEMKTCKMTKFKIKWFLQFPNHFRIAKETIIAIPRKEAGDDEDDEASPPMPQSIVLQSALRKAEEEEPFRKKVSFGGTEIFTFRKCASPMGNWWMQVAGAKKKKKGKQRKEAFCMPKVSQEYLTGVELPDDFSDEDQDKECCSNDSDGISTNAEDSETSTDSTATDAEIGSNRRLNTTSFWLHMYGHHPHLGRHALIREFR